MQGTSQSKPRKWRTVIELNEIMLMFVIIIVIQAVHVHAQTTVDPCETAIQLGQRERSILYVTVSGVPTICDNFLSTNAWYRFDGLGTGSKMPEKCVQDLFRCGTRFPVWVNGSQPTGARSSPVNVTVCSKTSATSACCAWTDTIKVKLCKNGPLPFYVYQLKPVSLCARGYCFGDILRCSNTTAWNNITNTCSSPRYPSFTGPVLSNPYVSNFRQVTDTTNNPFKATIFSVRCIITTPYVPRDGARFFVSFYMDQQFLVGFTSDGTTTTFTIEEQYLIGQLGKTMTCRVVSYWSSTAPLYSPTAVSNIYWYGVKPKSDTTNLDTTVVLHPGESFSFWLEPTFPITTGHCYYNPTQPCLASFTMNIETWPLVDDANPTCTKCSYVLSAVPRWDPHSNQFTVSPATPTGSLKSPFLMSVSFLTVPINKSSQIYDGYKIQSIRIQIVDNSVKRHCSAWGDPHITTFAGVHFDVLYEYGDYYLLNLTDNSRTFEIQVRTRICCGTANVACNCGIIVREGNNIIGINGCQPGTTAPLVVRYLTTLPTLAQTDQLIASTGPQSWKISLFSGIEITVDAQICKSDSLYLNIDVLGLKEEEEVYGGLCVNGSYSSTYEFYRVPPEKSFFNFNSTNQPHCVTETDNIIGCSCTAQAPDVLLCNKAVDPGLIAVAQFQTQNAHICVPGYPARRRKRSESDQQYPQNVVVDDMFLVTPPIKVTSSRPLADVSRTDALTQCDAILRSTPGYNICRTLIDVTPLREACVIDVQVGGMGEDFDTPFTALHELCLYKIKASMIYSSDNSTYSLMKNLTNLYNQVSQEVCTSHCNDGLTGSCSSGSCQCSQGYTGDYCTLSPLIPPNVTSLLISRLSVQQLLQMSQNIDSDWLQINIIVSASNIDRKGMLICNARNHYVTLLPRASNYVDGYIFCMFTTARNTLLDAQDKSLQPLYSFDISISNDNKIFSNTKTFELYDDNCYDCLPNHDAVFVT